MRGDIRVHFHNGSYVIASNFRTLETGGITGSRSHSVERTRTVFDAWCPGRGWASPTLGSIRFPTTEEADSWLQEHRQEVENG